MRVKFLILPFGCKFELLCKLFSKNCSSPDCFHWVIRWFRSIFLSCFVRVPSLFNFVALSVTPLSVLPPFSVPYLWTVHRCLIVYGCGPFGSCAQLSRLLSHEIDRCYNLKQGCQKFWPDHSVFLACSTLPGNCTILEWKFKFVIFAEYEAKWNYCASSKPDDTKFSFCYRSFWQWILKLGLFRPFGFGQVSGQADQPPTSIPHFSQSPSTFWPITCWKILPLSRDSERFAISMLDHALLYSSI